MFKVLQTMDSAQMLDVLNKDTQIILRQLDEKRKLKGKSDSVRINLYDVKYKMEMAKENRTVYEKNDPVEQAKKFF